MKAPSLAASLLASFSLCVFANSEALAEIAAKLTSLKGTTPAQWQVIWTGDAAAEATISWSTAEPGEQHVVHYGTGAYGVDVAKYEHHQECQSNGSYGKKGKPEGGSYHHAVINDLKPATRYHFVLESDGELSRPLYFITASLRARTFRSSMVATRGRVSWPLPDEPNDCRYGE